MKSKTRLRRSWIAIASGLACALIVSACAPSGASESTKDPSPTGQETKTQETSSAAQESTSSEAESSESAAPAEPTVIKVGFLSPVTGPIAAIGIEMKQGWELYWQEHGTTAGNFVVETVYEDDGGNPDTALSKAKRLVEEEKVDVVVGPLAANTALAVSDYLIQQGVPNFHPVTAADDITQRNANPLVIRVGAMSGSQPNYVAGKWAYDQGYRKAITLCSDYAFGWENCGGFVRTFTEAGGEIVGQLWNPLGTPDFSPYATQIASSGADLAFIGSSGGSDGVNFLRAYEDFGLADQIDVLGNCCLLDQSTLSEMGEVAEGLKSVTYYAEGMDTPSMRKFHELYDGAYGGLPSLYVANSYVTAGVFSEALKTIDGNEVDPEGLVSAARAVNLEDTVFGPRKIDEWNQPVGNVYITKVQKRDDGKYWNVVDETFTEVGQFGDFDPDAILKSPPYDRTNTGQQ
jgi:branched-chain amino acid transport system substrate-binding protein